MSNQLDLILMVFMWGLVATTFALILGVVVAAVDVFTCGKVSTLAKAWCDRLMPKP